MCSRGLQFKLDERERDPLRCLPCPTYGAVCDSSNEFHWEVPLAQADEKELR